MEIDFLDAAGRHRADAEFLFEHERWPNADQLYGFAAECGLKAVMMALGMPVDARGVPSRHRMHIDRLWDAFGGFAEGREAGHLAGYLGENPFPDWNVSQRYQSTASISPSAVEEHRRGTDIVFRLVAQVRLDGRLT